MKKQQTPSPLTADDILTKIPDVLDTYGWEKSEYETQNGVCLTAAAAVALGREHLSAVVPRKHSPFQYYVSGGAVTWLVRHDVEFRRALYALAKVIVTRRFEPKDVSREEFGTIDDESDATIEIVVGFNDWHTRRRRDVVRVCELARKQLAAET